MPYLKEPRGGVSSIGAFMDQSPVAYPTSAVGDDASGSQSTASQITDFVHSPAMSTIAAAAMVFHGYRRGGLLSAALWGLAGKFFPIETVPVAFAQGFGKCRCPGQGG
jgi:hypothetical protein